MADEKPNKRTEKPEGNPGGGATDSPDDATAAGAKAGWAAAVVDVLSPILRRLTRYFVFACLGALVVGVGVWLVIALPELKRMATSEPVRSAEEIAREKEAKIKEAEKTATWQNAHCKLLQAYYDGPEDDLPLAELVGLPADADEARIQNRCTKLLDAVYPLGGWPTAKPQQDNFVVCTGFRFELTGSFALSVRVTRESLAANTVLFGRPGNEVHVQDVLTNMAVRIGSYTPGIVRADGDCVVIGEKRQGRRREIPGRIVRDASAG